MSTTAYYAGFEVVLIDASGVRTSAGAQTLNVQNLTKGTSLGTKTSNASGIVAEGSFTGTLDVGDVVQFSHGTYPGTFNVTLQETQSKAYTEFGRAGGAMVLQNLAALAASKYVRIFAQIQGSDAPPIEIGAGERGTTAVIPYQTALDQDLDLTPVAFTDKHFSQTTRRVDDITPVSVSVPGISGPAAPSADPGHDVVASESITGPAFVNLFNASGTLKVRKANATDNTKPCNAYIVVNVTSGGTVTVYEWRGNTVEGLSGLTLGTTYFLSTTGGAITASPTRSTGNIIQSIGVAKSSTTLEFDPQAPITVA